MKLAMRELIRDTAFGKLARISSCHRVFCYPEEWDSSIASEYINGAAEEGNTALESGPNGSITEPNGLETIMSQASHRSCRGSIRTSSCIDEKTLIVTWKRGDSEVVCPSKAAPWHTDLN